MAGTRSENWWPRHETQLNAALAARQLTLEDVVRVSDAWRLSGCSRKVDRRVRIAELAKRVGSPAPPPAFIVGRVHYWLYDDILAWLAPLFARRWEKAYELRRADVVRRWKRSHSVRRPPRGVSNRYGYQGVGRVHDSVTTSRPFGAALHLQGKTRWVGYCPTPAEAGRLYDRALIAIGERPVNFPDDVATTMLLPEPHIGPKTSVTTVLLQIVDKHGPIETDAMLDLLPGWPVQPTRPTTREKARGTFIANVAKQGRSVLVEGGWVLADRAGLYNPHHGHIRRHRHDDATKERVLQLIREGQSVRSAALSNGLAVDTVYGWVHKAGISRSQPEERFTSEDRCSAARAYTGGESSGSIARRLGTHPRAVLRWVRAAGVEVRPKGRGGKISARRQREESPSSSSLSS